MRALLLLLALLAAGCIGQGHDTPTREPVNKTSANATSFALPDARGVSSAANETSATEKGAGGVAHTHDYWKGREDVVVFQRDVGPAIFPVFPGGQGTPPAGVVYITLPNTSLVYEGTTRVSFLVQVPKLLTVPEPAPADITFSYRTAADNAWLDGGALAFGTAKEIAVRPAQTDMPHSTQSLWNFRLLFSRPALFDERFNVTITVHRGADVVSWPGHPDFYPDGRTERTILDKDVKTQVYGFPQDGFYEGTEAWFAPDKLVSYGTASLDVFVNVSGFSSMPPLPATRYVLYAHNATQLGIGCCDGGTFVDAEGKNDLKSYHFHVNVSADGMDGPYQPASRWGFHLAAVTAAFTDSTSYEIAYHVTIVAHKAEGDSMAGMTM